MADPRRLLAVFAHPDDETFLAGGTLARHVDEGWDVRLLTLTRGEAGRRGPYRDLSAQAFGAVRETELREACAALGLRHVEILGIPDKAVGPHHAAAFDAVLRMVEQWRPDLVITFGPDGISGHPDHVAVSHLVTAAVQHVRAQAGDRTAAPSLYYVARSPGVPNCCVSKGAATPLPVTTVVPVTGTAESRQQDARRAYRSQAHLLTDAPVSPAANSLSEMFHRALPPAAPSTLETVAVLR